MQQVVSSGVLAYKDTSCIVLDPFNLIVSAENMSLYVVTWEVGLLMSDVWGRRRGGEFNHDAALNARAACFPASLLHLCR